MTDKEQIPDKFKGKGKTGKYCGYRINHYCNSNCGMYMEGLGSCVLHGINQNLRMILEEIKEKKK